ncbi:MAG: HK97 gp10 family phage protein [Gemmataceae bacterium]|nr:HK97 gp10 family phage protein [Gemmataceae bacterium]
MADDMFIKGADELIQALKDLPLELNKAELRAGLVKGAQFLRDRIREAAPVSDNVPPRGGRFKGMKPGNLRRSIKARGRRGTRTEAAAAVTGPFYAKWVEFGHTLKSHGKKADRRVIGHVPANPFIRTTVEANKEAVVDEVRKGVVAYLARRFQRLRGKRPSG